jgi:hypothetical protein
MATIVIAWIAFQSSYVQTWLVAETTKILQKQMGTDVSIGSVDIRLFNRVVLSDVYISDLRHDTLLSASRISATFLRFSNSERLIKLNRVTLKEATINFRTDSLGVMNLTELLAALPKDTVSKVDSSSFTIAFNHVSIVNSTFNLSKSLAVPKEFGVNFDVLKLNNLNLEANNITIAGDTISMTLENIAFRERSGMVLNSLRADFSIGSTHMFFDRLRVNAMGSIFKFPHARFTYGSWNDLSDFLSAVRLDVLMDKSVVSTSFLSYFVPSIKFLQEDVTLSCSAKGRISDLRVRDLIMQYGKKTVLETNFTIAGLPNIDQTYLFVDVKKLTTTISDIEGIKNVSTRKSLVTLPPELNNLGNVSYKGNFTGFISDFVAFGTISTDVGQLTIDVSIRPDKYSFTNFKGDISTKGLNIGALIGSTEVGRTSLKASVKGHIDGSNKIEAYTDATIYLIEANKYPYSNIKITGNLTSKAYVGSVIVDDPNVKVNFLGKVDFADSIPVFDFSAFVPRIDLVKTNLNKVDSISQASFLLTAKFTGSNLDNSRGEIKIVNSLYRNQYGEVKTADVTITANNSDDSKSIIFKSEFADGELRGKYNYANIFGLLSQLVYEFIPSLSPDNKKPERQASGVENPEYNDYIIKLRVKKTQKLLDVVMPGFKIAENTNVFAIYNPDLQSMNLKVKIPEIVLSGNTIKDISIDGQTTDSTFITTITSPSVDLGGSIIRNVAITATAFNNKIVTQLGWDNRLKPRNQGEIKSTVSFIRNEVEDPSRIRVNIHPSIFFINDTAWRVMSSYVAFDSSEIKVKNITVLNGVQSLRVSGIISTNPSDSIVVALNKISLANLNFYTRSMGYEFSGQISGMANIKNVLKQPLFVADISTPNLAINNQKIGNVEFFSKWFADEEKLALRMRNLHNDTLALEIEGDFYPETSKISFGAKIGNLGLTALAPLLAGNVSNLNGYLSGNLNITGSTTKPIVNGIIYPMGTSMTIDFLKTNYRIADPIVVDNSNILLNNFRIYDLNNRVAVANGSVQTDFFRDISFSLSLAPSNFQLMNTTEKDNELFYGSVYGTGVVQINGKPDNINMYVSIRTEPKTAIFLPLSSSTSVTEYNFVNFINDNENQFIIDEELVAEAVKQTNLSLTLDLDITSDAEAQIIIDKKVGDIIKANGAGKLKMDINPSQDKFRMFGDYVIEKGDYLFTLQGVINKKLRIAEGSSINWNGDVTDASVNIKAIYGVRTSLSQLLLDQENEKYKKRTQVDCQILLTGKLMEPNINFNIDVPSADNETSALIQSALNTEEKMSRQFLSLLVIGSFLPDPGASGNINTSQSASNEGGGWQQGVANSVGELFSNQLSNWVSQWSNNFDLGINYRPGDPSSQLSSNEWEFAVSTQLFNDRVTINGNVDMGNQNTSSPIAGDFSIDVKLNPSGKVRAKAFARSNDDPLEQNQSTHTTGVGILYREDFNTFGELWDRFKNIFKSKPKEKESEPVEENGVYMPNGDGILPSNKKNNNSSIGMK